MTEVKQFPQIGKFIDSLQLSSQAKVLKQISLLTQFGSLLGMPYSRRLGKNLYELRSRGQQEIRIFYFFQSNTAILVHAFIKKTQNTPRQEIDTAKSRISLFAIK